MLQYNLGRNCEKGSISIGKFKQFLELNEKHKASLVPYGTGEPTFNPDFVAFCNLTLDEGWKLSNIHTNLSLPNLSSKVFEALCHFEDVTVNFGGATEETQKINMSTSFEQTFSNFKRFIETKKALKSNVKISVKMVLNKYNIGEREKLKALLKVPVQCFPIYFAVSDGSEIDKRLFLERNISDFTVCRDSIKLEEDRIVVVSKLKKCYGLIPTIHVNGDVSVCCRSRWYGGFVGNAFEKPMSEILVSQAYREAVKKALRRKYVEYCRFCS